MNTLKTLISVSGLIVALGGWSAASAYTFNFDSNAIFKKGAFFDTNAKFNHGVLQNPSEVLSVKALGWSLNYSNNKIQSENLIRYTKGLGVQGSGDEAHYVDNKGKIDFVSFAFFKEGVEKKVSITSITLTIWDTDNSHNKDADITLKYDGLANIKGVDQGTLLNHYTKNSLEKKPEGTEVTYTAADLGPMQSSALWKIFASLDNKDGIDGFKIKSMAVTETVVPLPAAVWLFGSALLGMVGIGYRRQTKQI